MRMFAAPRGLTLVGMYYAGKSAAARNIAGRTDVPSYDLDDIYTCTFHETIWETRARNPHLARPRRDAIGNAMVEQVSRKPQSVAVFGAGSFFRDNPQALGAVRRHHVVVWLKPSINTLTARAIASRASDVRTVLNGFVDEPEIRESLVALSQARAGYSEWCDAVVEPDISWPPERTAGAILARLPGVITLSRARR